MTNVQCFTKCLLSITLMVFLFGCEKKVETPPNIVIIFLDDSGWADFHPFGKPAYPTPHVETLAKEGTRYNQFYVPQAICSASRSALLSGCYPERTKVFGAHGPNGRGLEVKFATMAEVFKKNNVRYFIYNGGNDSMDTCVKLSEYLKTVDYEMYVIGLPKTVDNDLPLTDHTPGFGSAAKFIINTLMQVKFTVK